MKVEGWNLPSTTVELNPAVADGEIHTISWSGKGWHTNEALYAVDSLPEVFEAEPNNFPDEAQKIDPPAVVNGRMDAARDTDVFQIEGKRGEEVVAEVIARRLNSPIDSVVHLLDEKGEVVAWNDDHMEKDEHLHLGDGLVTHHSDSYLRATLPRDGRYFLQIEDTSKQGGAAFGYRMRVGSPRPDFRLRVTPSTINARIWEKVDGAEVARAATPADNQMQAFLWRHLVPAHEMRVAVIGKWKPDRKAKKKQQKKNKVQPKSKEPAKKRTAESQPKK